MLKTFKRSVAAHRLLEEKLYEYVALEIQNGIRRDGLWAKALVQSDGSEEKAKASYIKLRVQSLKDEAHIEEAIEEMIAKLIANGDIALEEKEEPKKEPAKIDKPKSFPQNCLGEVSRAAYLASKYPEKKVSIEIHASTVCFTTPNGSQSYDNIEDLRNTLAFWGLTER